jgi:uncharacterized phosphosugar-binding protein
VRRDTFIDSGENMAKLSRRNALKTGAALAAGTAAAGTAPRFAGASDRAESKCDWGHTVDFGEQYFSRTVEMLTDIRTREMELIGELSGRMAEALKKGGNVWMQAQAGHMGYIEFDEKLKGNPKILRSSLSWGGGSYDLMKPGDVLMTNYVSEPVRSARDRGVYVIGVPCPYVDNEWAPRGYVTPNANNWLLGDVSNVILQSYIPYTQGLVDCPEVPEMKVCPGAANPLCALFWMFQCEVANKVKNPGAKPVDKAAIMLDAILDRLAEVWRTQKDLMFDTAATVAKIIGGGGHYHVTSDHSGVQSEATSVAMGLWMINFYRSSMKKGDVHLLTTIEPDSPAIVIEAEKARDMGMFVIAIAPGNSMRIRRASDVFIDNLSPEGGGLLDIPGFPGKVGTAGGVLNNTLHWTFTAQVVDEMVRRGWIPWFRLGDFAVGGTEYKAAIRQFFLKQGF